MKNDTCRFSISMKSDLVDQLDEMTRTKGLSNRSHAVAQMVKDHLVDHYGQTGNHEIAGTITLVYDHHKRNIQSHLTEIQHDHQSLIISALHVHLDHHNCLEVLAVKGRASEIRKLADRITGAKGIKHGKLTVTTTGKEFLK